MEWKQPLGDDDDVTLEVTGSAKLFSKGAQVRSKGVRCLWLSAARLWVNGGTEE